MSEKALKRNWLRERNEKQTDVKKGKLEELQTIDYLNKHGIRFKNCSFVENAGQKAKQMKIMENALRYQKDSKDLSYPSMYIKFLKCLIDFIVTDYRYILLIKIICLSRHIILICLN